jgi:hypothetical protein
MTVPSLVFRTDGSIEDLLLDQGPNDLRLMQAAVGGYIELITFAEDLLCYVNEEGMLMGLPVNPSASGLLARFNLTHVSASGMLQGDVLLTGHDGSPDTVGVPEHWREKLRQWGFKVPI